MSVVLQTGVMYYRENQNDDWHPLILKADADLSSFIEDYSQRAWELGEYCRYHNVIYRCTTAITTPETWNSSHWTATDVGEELTSIRNTLNQLDTDKADKIALAFVRTGTTNTSQIYAGTYFFLNGTMKRAIADIGVGAAFTDNNCVTVPDGGINSLKPELGTYGNWEIVKWADGRYDAYYSDTNYSFTATTQRGSLYYCDVNLNLPTALQYPIVASGSIGGNVGTAMPLIANLRAYQTTVNFSIGSAINTQVTGTRLSIIVHGHWI